MNSFFEKFKYKIVLPTVVDSIRGISNVFKKPRIDSDQVLRNLFIVGSGRNGSTLLALLLNRNQNVFLPSEQYALPYAIYKFYLTPRFLKNWDKLTTQILNDFTQKNNNWDTSETDYNELQKRLSSLPKENRSVRNIYNVIFAYLSETSGKNVSVLGDHSPVTALHYKSVAKEFPNDLFIVLVRHPYDVLLSHSKMGDVTNIEPDYVVFKWKDSIKMYDWLKSNNYNVKLLKYEDLVTSPEAISNDVQKFLNVEVENLTVSKNVNSHVDSLGVSDMEFHKNLYKPISADSIGKWKNELPMDIQNRYKSDLKEFASRFNYELD